MMDIRSIGILLMLLMLKCDLLAQSIVTSDKDIVQFLQQVKELGDDGDASCSVYAVNMLTYEGYTVSDKCRLYRIGTMASHACVYLMWLDNNGRKHFIDCNNDLFNTIREVFTLWEESKCEIPDSDKIKYIEDIIYTFDNNRNRVPD